MGVRYIYIIDRGERTIPPCVFPVNVKDLLFVTVPVTSLIPYDCRFLVREEPVYMEPSKIEVNLRMLLFASRTTTSLLSESMLTKTKSLMTI